MTTLEHQTLVLEVHARRCAVLAERIALAVDIDPSVVGSAALLHEGPTLPPYDLEDPRAWLVRAADAAFGIDPRRDVAEAVRLHRERGDGSGPFGLHWWRIPPNAAIVGLVHAYDIIVDGDRNARSAAVELLAGRQVFPARLIAALEAAEITQ